MLIQEFTRYYFLEQATGRTQWDPPQPSIGSHSGFSPPMAPLMASHGYEAQGQQGGSSGYYSQEVKQTVDSHGEGHKEVYQKKEKSGKGGMLAAGAGGLAVGAVGGALVGHAMGTWLLRMIWGSAIAAVPLQLSNTSRWMGQSWYKVHR